MEQLFEMLKEMKADRKTDKEMLARMDAGMKTHQEEMRVNQAKADADQVNEIFRKQILTILIESFEKLPVALAVGESLLQNLNDHPWAQTFSKYVISLQSDTFLKSYL